MSLPGARILAIESSCDETAAAIIENGSTLLGSAVSSQMEMHARFGGVFPEVASRQHLLSAIPVVESTLAEAHMTLADLDAIAVTRGPGLAGSLLVGLNLAKGLALGTNLPLIGINHLESHLYSAWISSPEDITFKEPEFPLVALLVSGGHTELNLMNDHLDYVHLGVTLDDAAGEAFDKVARILGLSYPGGPSIQIAAENGDPQAIDFPRAWLDDTWNFSFSGLKTSVLRQVRELETASGETISGNDLLPVNDLAASFQAAVVDVLFSKTISAAQKYGVKQIIIAGGVSANKVLRQKFLDQNEFQVNIPPLAFCTDNAAMVAAAGYYRFALGHFDPLSIDILPTWPLSSIS